MTTTDELERCLAALGLECDVSVVADVRRIVRAAFAAQGVTGHGR
ncbi:MAG: hypothetical protein ACJ79R_20545 [Anaeromyxobacteraceae bacterium]